MMLYKPQLPTFTAADIPDSRDTIVRSFLRIGGPIATADLDALAHQPARQRALPPTSCGPPPFVRESARELYGVYGKAQTFYNLPSYFITPLTLSIVPAIVGHLTRGNRAAAGHLAESSLRISALVTMPMAVGLFVLADPVFA